MASHDIIKQSSRIAGLVKDKDHALKHKLGEILIEILIIVFAISLSLFFDRWRQNVENRKQESVFLEGLKIDLTNDVEQLKASERKWAMMRKDARYFIQPENLINWNRDTINFYSRDLFHNVYFFPSTNRYEALKSTGKIDIIENPQLQNAIIDLYQTKIPDLTQQVTFFNEFLNTQTMNFLIENLQRDDNSNPILDKHFFTNMKFRNILIFYNGIDDVQKRADSTIRLSESILTLLNKRPN